MHVCVHTHDGQRSSHVCVGMCTCACVCTHTWWSEVKSQPLSCLCSMCTVHVCTHIHDSQRSMLVIFVYCCLSSSLRQCLSLNLKFASLVRLPGQQALRIWLSLPPQPRLDTFCHAKLNMKSEDLSSDPHTCTSAFLTQTSPSPFLHIFIYLFIGSVSLLCM